MGVRKSTGKNKKPIDPAAAIATNREHVVSNARHGTAAMAALDGAVRGRHREPDVVRQFQKRLAAARLELIRTAATTDEELATVGPTGPGDAADGAALGVAAATLARLKDHERHELEEIDAAEARLDDGTFGVYAGCGGAISLARLRALPIARLCLHCQARVER
jgi:DnaK suppressor protein